MRITILAYGTRGDFQPFLALGLALSRAGHDVCIAAPAPFAAFAAEHDIPFVPLPGDPRELSRLVAEGGRGGVRTMRAVLVEFVLPVASDVMRAVREACAGADLIVHGFMMTVTGHALARELDVPDVSVQTFPVFVPTAAFPSLLVPQRTLGPVLNRLSHRALSQAFWQASRAGYYALRRRTGMNAQVAWPFRASGGRAPTPVLFAFSRHVVPVPPDWGAGVHVTGYWFLDSSPGWQLSPVLQSFLDAGPPPVCVGFGSVVAADVPRLARIAAQALEAAGERGILLGGWVEADLDEAPWLLQAGPIPHEWLYPRVAAAVHHGGAGTTAAAIRAGTPSVVIPFSADQPFWARRVHALGVSPPPIPHRELTVERLASAVRAAAHDGVMRARATDLAAAIRREDGLAEAVRLVEAHAARYVASHPPLGTGPAEGATESAR